MKRFLCALAILLAGLPSAATTFATSASDLWWNPAEDGWGLNVVQQDTVLFATLFTYGPDSQPTWYVGSNLGYFTTNASGGLVYTGPWYQTTGPWFGGPFNANARTTRQVGTATFTLNSVSSATFTYTVDGTPVTKTIERQTWRNEVLTGTYVGAMIGTYSNCTPSSLNGYSEDAATFAVTHAGSQVTIVETGADYSCTYSGTYQQKGRMGQVMNGTLACSGGITGTFSAIEIEANITGITARVTAQNNVCSFNGRFGGLLRGS